MGKENEQSIISSSGQNNEIQWLCDAEKDLKGEIEFYPKGSCNWNIAKIHLRQVRTRLEELGVDEIIVPDSLNGCGRPRTGDRQDIEGGQNLPEIREYYEEDDDLGKIKRSRYLGIGKK